VIQWINCAWVREINELGNWVRDFRIRRREIERRTPNVLISMDIFIAKSFPEVT
jgi:hypothetical protein